MNCIFLGKNFTVRVRHMRLLAHLMFSVALGACLCTVSPLGQDSAALAAPKVSARWKFNEAGSGNTTADSSGLGRNLVVRTSMGSGDLASPTPNATVNFVPGLFGNAADVPGNRVLGGPDFSVGVNSFPNNTASLTVTGWVFPRARGTILDERSQSGYAAQTLAIDTSGADPQLHGRFYNTGVTTVPGGTTPATLNEWHFVALRYDRTVGPGTTHTFLDGTFSNAVVGDRSPPASFGQPGDHFILGQNSGAPLGGNSNVFFNGLLDDFTIWADPLSDTQLLALYNFGRHNDLQYDSETVGDLFALFEAGSGTLNVDGILWQPFGGPFPTNPDTNLAAAPGDVFFANDTYFALLGAGVGLAALPPLAPEPASLALWGFSALFAAGALWRRKQRRGR